MVSDFIRAAFPWILMGLWEVSPENVTVSYTTGSDTESFNIDHRP